MENLNNWIIVTNDFIWTYILLKPCSSVSGSTLQLQNSLQFSKYPGNVPSAR